MTTIVTQGQALMIVTLAPEILVWTGGVQSIFSNPLHADVTELLTGSLKLMSDASAKQKPSFMGCSLDLHFPGTPSLYSCLHIITAYC